MIDRIRGADRRRLVFAAFAIALVIAAVVGVLDSQRDVEIDREEAVLLARPHIDFEPVNEDARLIRQGFQMAPVWAVSFSIPVEGNPRDFKRLMTVEVDARTGEVLRISTDGGGDEEPET